MKINYVKENKVEEIDVRCFGKNIYFKLHDIVKCVDLKNIDEDEAVKRLSKILGENISDNNLTDNCYATFEGLKDLRKSQDLKYICSKESFDELFEFIKAVLDGLKNKKESSEEEKLKQEFNYHLQEAKKHMDAAIEFQRKLLELDVKEKENDKLKPIEI